MILCDLLGNDHGRYVLETDFYLFRDAIMYLHKKNLNDKKNVLKTNLMIPNGFLYA